MRIIRVIILMILPLIFSCAEGSSSLWKAYTFDGSNFSPAADNSSKAIWIRSGHFPLAAEAPPGSNPSDILPPGSGAVAGICYIQTTGGRISERNLFTPYINEQITLRNKTDGTFVTRTDSSGYFVEFLNPGEYELFCRGVRTEFRIKQGETTLVPIRGGKRMAD